MGVNVVNAQPTKTQRVEPQRSAQSVSSQGAGLSVASPIYKLQRAVGNRATSSLLRSRIIQAKLTVSHPDDEYEREADRVADQVMRMPDADATVRQTPMQIQQMCSECEEEEKLQRQPSHASANIPTVSSALETYLAASRGGGQPLAPSTRVFFEPRFGQTLVHVRIHTDNRAAEASKDIRAQAFTAGSDIYFAHGQYRPGSDSGDRLLGHELTHVLQQERYGNRQTIRPQGEKATPKRRPKLANLLKDIEQMRERTNERVKHANDYLEEGLSAAGTTWTKIDKAADAYETAFNQHEKILKQAGASAKAKEELADMFISFGLGVAFGFIGGEVFAAVAKDAGTGLKILKEVLTEAAKVVASEELKRDPPGFEPAGMNSLAFKVKHYAALVDIYHGLAVTGHEALGESMLATWLTELRGEVRLLKAGQRADYTAEQVVESVSKIKKAEPTLDIYYPSHEAAELMAAIQERPVPTSYELEQMLWVQWMSRLGYYDEDLNKYVFGDTSVLDEDVIEDYLHGSIGILGKNSLLGVDFGSWTSTEDERDAVIAANDKWTEMYYKYKPFL